MKIWPFNRGKTIGNYRPKTLWDFFMRFYESDRQRMAMAGYIREKQECEDYNRYPSKKLMRRYLLNPESNHLAWFLLEKYFEGKIKIEE